ncbi:hypothetical protein SAMD00019534_043220 [Acytostelium subglobosum LB1]|uniref:hypothetical protein n=1 Tax=Acytostelium subglobosum LB1 TaxID=1410327 RepID=UPI0006449988|nr:hypothetical protein SAMD00019534_043220 [Acytostelium subglobosum LB1]GAM21147.1 hypothetical protein SAMD00019534_043220 [Acytostelium subglobosum LB1]|eukprot:XP_012756281.1 hypothetical protein SAMD00019534_043220 [Acytostelium subglobosum LB1]
MKEDAGDYEEDAADVVEKEEEAEIMGKVVGDNETGGGGIVRRMMWLWLWLLSWS